MMLVLQCLCETPQRWQHDVVMLLPCEAITLGYFVYKHPLFIDKKNHC